MSSYSILWVQALHSSFSRGFRRKKKARVLKGSDVISSEKHIRSRVPDDVWA